MYRHAYFDLLLHTDEELAGLLRQPVTARDTLHEWPLSCVQRITMGDGSSLIYKAASGPTVEAAFYRAARSPALVAVDVLYQDAQYSCLALEDLGKVRSGVAPDDPLREGQGILREIAQIRGNPPVYQDFCTYDLWKDWGNWLEESLERLVATRAFRQVKRNHVKRMVTAARSFTVQRLWDGAVGLAHNDLTIDNIFRTESGYKIIDWQRPVRGPIVVDLVDYLQSCGADLSAVGQGAVWFHHLLRAGWLVECSLRWFPNGMPTYDRMIAKIEFA